MDSTTSTFFQTCLKIRGLGEDTAGTLDALGKVCAASGRGEVRTPGEDGEGETEGGADSLDAHSGAVELSNGPADQSNEGSGTAKSTAPPPGDAEAGVEGVDRSEAEAGGGVTTQQTVPPASSSPPALWSLEFAHSGLERVLEALETAVSGLVFLVRVAPRQDAQSETSVIWCVAYLIAVEGAVEEMWVMADSHEEHSCCCFRDFLRCVSHLSILQSDAFTIVMYRQRSVR